jgi:YHS domain-containing protein
MMRTACAASFALLLAACGAAGPHNLVPDQQDKRLMLKGNDPVGYFKDGKNQPGNPAIKAVHDGVVYRFVSAENKAAFLEEPSRYVPQFGGYCANGIAYGIPWGGDPDTFRIIDGKLYIFGGRDSMNYFLMDEKRNLALADKYWKEEVQGRYAILQRLYRLVVRVPHYKTGKELAEEYESRRGRARQS